MAATSSHRSGRFGASRHLSPGTRERAAALALPERQCPPQVHHFLAAFDTYRATVARVIAFLQGRDPTLAHRINTRSFLPEGARFQALDSYPAEEGEDPLAWAFGALGLQDRARHLATLYLNDLADVVREAVDPRFEFVRYAEQLATSQPHFDPLAEALAAPPHLLDRTLATVFITHPHIDHTRGLDVVMSRYVVKHLVTNGLAKGPSRLRYESGGEQQERAEKEAHRRRALRDSPPREETLDGGDKVSGLHGLGDVGVHPCLDASLTVAIHGVCRHGNDRHVPAAVGILDRANGGGRVEAAEFRHHHVAHDQVGPI